MGVSMLYQSLKSLLNLQLQELYVMETHLAREMQRYIEGAVSSEFKSQLNRHTEETRKHSENLARLLRQRNIDPNQARCRTFDALIKRGGEIVESRGSDMLIDLGLVLQMRSIETLEQRAYEDAKMIAEALGEDDVVEIIDAHLRDEGQQECSWTVLAEDMVDEIVSVAVKAGASELHGEGSVQ